MPTTRQQSRKENSEDSGWSDNDSPGLEMTCRNLELQPFSLLVSPFMGPEVTEEGATPQLQLLTPDTTPIESTFPLPVGAGYPQLINQQPIAPTPEPYHDSSPSSQAFVFKGMLQHDDEVLRAQLTFSRRGASAHYSSNTAGHCSRDTADLWFYILGLFFTHEQGYYLTVSNYTEQNALANNGECIPGGQPVTVQVWRQEGHYHPLYRQWVRTAQIPVLVVLCGSGEQGGAEYPAVRHHVMNLQTLSVKTALQKQLYKALSELLNTHNEVVDEGRCSAAELKSLNGAIACGTMVRFVKLKSEEMGSGVLKTWSAKGLDLVNGDPSSALSMVEKILGRILQQKGKAK